MRAQRFFVGVDIGGTFTDVTLAEQDTNRLYTSKKLTTPEDPSRGVLEALQDALGSVGAQPGAVDRVIHATTLATNLILEGKGARVAYVTTQGFGDVLMLGGRRDGGRFDLYFDRVPPPVPRDLTIEAVERMDARGQVLVPLNEEQLASDVRRLAAQGVQAVAVCLLHSYINPAHERRIGEIVKRYLPGVHVALSCEVWPEYREYDRATTTVMSAYVGPLMASYVQQLEGEIKAMGIPGSLHIMQSSGGVMSAAVVVTKPIQSVESGPAAGVIAACHLGQLYGHQDVISFDMGGTTAKAGLIRDGKPNIVHEFYVGGQSGAVGHGAGTGYLIKMPVIDMAEVGAGGGSIAWVDSGGSLRVGPHSAGANPGPACYKLGGDQPTVTDADLVLGYLNPDYFLGGKMRVYPELSRQAIERNVAGRLGMDAVTAASGIYEIVNANMASAIRIVTVERGINPRDFTVLGFGGAGPAHIVKVAEQFNIPNIVIPISPGLTSSLGLLVSDMTNDYVRSKIMDQNAIDMDEINAIYEELESNGIAQMAEEGIPRESISVERQVDTRFRFQAHELPVPMRSGRLRKEDMAEAETAFRDLYHRLYAVRQGTPVQFVNYRVRVTGSVPKVQFAPTNGTRGDAGRALKGSRPVYFKEAGGFVETRVYDRGRLSAGAALTGPAVVEEPDSTTIIPPSYRGTVNSYLAIVINRE